MKIAILGTGTVGDTLASALVAREHEVKMGSRSATNEKAAAWATKHGALASHGTFGDAAAWCDLALLCVNGGAAVDAAKAAAAGLAGKILIDVTNSLDFSKGFPPSLMYRGDDSLGERVQAAVPAARVVKALNTVNAQLMTSPKALADGDHDLFIAGNDEAAKASVREHLGAWFGWTRFVDLGDITAARATETYLALWVRVMSVLKTPQFSIKVVR
jgi:predicted dinucleotide-binding enzyme